jgi:hypothetical protein
VGHVELEAKHSEILIKLTGGIPPEAPGGGGG